jgi:hypothetical protein
MLRKIGLASCGVHQRRGQATTIIKEFFRLKGLFTFRLIAGAPLLAHVHHEVHASAPVLALASLFPVDATSPSDDAIRPRGAVVPPQKLIPPNIIRDCCSM